MFMAEVRFVIMNRRKKLDIIEIRNWEGGSMKDVVSFLEDRSRVTLSNQRMNSGLVTVQVLPKNANAVLKLNGIKFSGRKLDIKLATSKNPQTSNTIQLLKAFLTQRYNPQANLLNLSSLMFDPLLQSNGLLDTRETALKMFQALMKVAQDTLEAGVKSVSLDSNGLEDAELVGHVANSFPKLQNLSLGNNQINNIASLVNLGIRLPKLRELILAGNPVQQHPSYATSLVGEIVTAFPCLMIIDGVQVRSEADLPRNSIALPVQPTFYEDPAVSQVVTSFLANFFHLWDTNRAELQVLYDNASTFSFCMDGTAPHLPGPSGGNPKLTQLSRNLERISGNHTRHSRLHVGPASILQTFQQLPPSKHDLTRADLFQIDAWKVQDIRAPGDTAIIISVHGQFNEYKRKDYSFDRSLVVLPGPQGYIVASDMLTIRGLSSLIRSNPANTATQAAQPAPVVPVVPGAPVTPMSNHAGTQQVTPVGQITPVAQQSPLGGQMGGQMGQPMGATPQMGAVPPVANPVEELIRQTNLKPEFAQMCLNEANFDLNAALQLFQQSRSQLGPDAFQF